MHPELSRLTRLIDAELTGRELRTVQRHLSACPDCRSEAERIRLALVPGDLLAVPPVEALLTGMRQWRDRQARNPFADSRRKQRVALEIAPFLGSAGAEEILSRVTPEGDDLIPTVEPVLASFLVRRAAERLVNHVVDAAIVRASW